MRSRCWMAFRTVSKTRSRSSSVPVAAVGEVLARELAQRLRFAEQSFRHLAAGGVVRAEEEDAFLQLTDSFPIHWKSNVAASAPTSCATIKAGMPAGAIPENVSVRPRAIVTAGFAKLVLDVNQ